MVVRAFCLIFAGVCVQVACAGAPFAIDATRPPAIVLQGAFRPFVAKAADDVANDISDILGVRPAIGTNVTASCTNAIVLVRGGAGWENYSVESKAGNVLVITGSDDRGVMFGLYRFARECLGVDPFRYWSGLEPEKASRKTWPDGIAIRQGDPSFRFRGWFVNDEDFLNGFRPQENGTRRIAYPRYHVCFGPFLADKIYESAVRAGFNLMVCASYVDILNPDEKRLVDIASSRGLYITMHHQEPVGASALFLDVHFPEMRETSYASHPELWRKAWKTYIDAWAKVPDVIWQLGLRGRKDRPFWAELKDGNWSDWGVESEEEDRRRAGLISQAMDDQIGMIRAATGGRPFRTATQLWMEGAQFYRRGLLKIPAETTVMFSDNSPGLKFQPDLGGVKRLPPGRTYGLYYHLAVVCGNHHCELVPPFRTQEILSDARSKGASELLLVNVSNIRPFLYTISAVGEMARDLASFAPPEYQRAWCGKRFGDRAAADASRALDLYFSAYETEFSRDGVSSYGSPRERAPLAVLNDGDMIGVIGRLLARVRNPQPCADAPSPFRRDPDALRDITSSGHFRVNQDMFPALADDLRYAARARAQSASFRRCLDQVEKVRRSIENGYSCPFAPVRQLFERIGYPAGFMCLASACCSKLALAAAAREEGDDPAALGHLREALSLARERDALDRRYNTGKWAHWYDRNIIYPYPCVTGWIAAELAALEKRSAASGFRLPVVTNRRAAAEVVCPEQPHAAERFAADELSCWFGEMTGAYVPVRSERTASAEKPRLYVGAAFARKAFARDLKKIGKTDGFAVRTDGTNVYLFGAQPKGTLHAAYALLEKNTDIIWPRPDPTLGAVHSRMETLVVTNADFCELPRTQVRDWQWNHTGREGAPNEFLWGARNRQNRGGEPDGPLASCFVVGGKGHGLQRYARPETSFAAHPEWFPLIGGARTTEGGQLCMTADGLAETLYASVTNELARTYPGVPAKRVKVDYFNLTCADNNRVCACESCVRPFRCENGKVVPISDPCFRSAQYYTLMNKVARLLKKTHPQVTIGTYAYALTRYAPSFELEPNVSVQLCLTDYDERASLTDPVRNLSARRHVDGWGDKCHDLWLRTYCGWSGRNLRAIEYAYAEACRYAAKRRFPMAQYSAEIQRDEEVKGRHGADIWDTSALTYWVVSRLWWDPFQDVDALRREFVTRTYREAAPQMQAYFDAIRDAYAADRMPATYRITGTAFMTRHYLLEPGLGPKLLGLLDEALAAARHPVSREIIRRQRRRLADNLARADAVPACRLAVRPLSAGWAAADESRAFVGAAGIYGTSCDVYGGPAEVKTTLKALHDDEALYLRIRCEAPDARTLYGASGNGSPEEQPDCDDALEIFLCRPDTGAYWQFIMDPGAKDGRDVVFDTESDDARWRGNWTREVTRDDAAWTVTLRVPFADMHLAACPDQLRVNVIRARRPLNPPKDAKGKPRHLRSSWSGGGVHDSGGFGLLQFVNCVL